MTDPEHDLLTRPEVAAVLRTPLATLHQWASRGYGPRFFRVGRKALYRRAEVESWLEEQERREAVGAP